MEGLKPCIFHAKGQEHLFPSRGGGGGC